MSEPKSPRAVLATLNPKPRRLAMLRASSKRSARTRRALAESRSVDATETTPIAPVAKIGGAS